MSKYALAKAQLEALEERATEGELDVTEVLEALMVLGVQELIKRRGAAQTREFLQYELNSVSSSSDGFHDIQKR